MNLVQSGQIDIAISPAQATIGTLLARVRRGDCAAVHSLRRGAAEALELVAHGDAQIVARWSGGASRSSICPKARRSARSCAGARAPTGRATTAAPVYDYEVLMAHHDVVIEPEDHVIVFVVNKRNVPKVEKLFQVNVSFL